MIAHRQSTGATRSPLVVLGTLTTAGAGDARYLLAADALLQPGLRLLPTDGSADTDGALALTVVLDAEATRENAVAQVPARPALPPTKTV